MIVRAAQDSQLHPWSGWGGGGGAAPLHFGKLLQNDKFSDRYFNQLNRTFWGWGFEEAGECGRFKLSGLKCGAKVKTCVS